MIREQLASGDGDPMTRLLSLGCTFLSIANKIINYKFCLLSFTFFGVPEFYHQIIPAIMCIESFNFMLHCISHWDFIDFIGILKLFHSRDAKTRSIKDKSVATCKPSPSFLKRQLTSNIGLKDRTCIKCRVTQHFFFLLPLWHHFLCK